MTRFGYTCNFATRKHRSALQAISRIGLTNFNSKQTAMNALESLSLNLSSHFRTGSIVLISLAAMTAISAGATENNDSTGNTEIRSEKTKSKKDWKSRFRIGGYGEVTMSKNFYSDSYLRYISPDNYKGQSHGRFDIPHAVIYLGYDFGKGWSMATEIEFEHGGTESAIEFENEEGGEYETEVERGGEVFLEQFWLQKSFMPQLNVRAGMMVVPVGATNAHHMPTEFFGVFRPEGENTIIPCTWHEIGLSIWGKAGDWRYEAMFLPGLDSERFGNQSWVHDGSASPYEFKIANSYAAAVRVDNTSVKGLRLSLSGYIGNSFRNTMAPTSGINNKGIHGTVAIGAFDFCYNGHGILARGNFDYGHLSDSKHITKFNMNMSNKSPSKHQKVASDAIATGVEVGYDLFHRLIPIKNKARAFYIFGRYDYYDSMYSMESDIDDKWCGRQRIAFGINFFPIRDIVVKGEYSLGILDKKYNNEPAISIGIAYSGWFIK